jgi:membrane protease YdiL (CAAX protease family)
MVALSKNKHTTILRVPWNIFDILAVLILTVIFAAVLYGLFFISFNNQNSIFKYFSYSFPLVTIFVPYLWLKKRHSIKWNSLGLRSGKYRFVTHFILGTVTAFLIILLMRIIPFLYEATLKNDTIHIRNFFAILLTPLTLTGFAKFILAPFGEEILFRGVVYGYCRGKVGIVLGIFVQAFISTIMHLFYIKEAYLSNHFFSTIIYLISINIILALLYEKANSLYPSIICHSIFNYLLFIY